MALEPGPRSNGGTYYIDGRIEDELGYLDNGLGLVTDLEDRINCRFKEISQRDECSYDGYGRSSS